VRITIAHSPDADDAFLFAGLALGRVQTEGLSFEHVLLDIETLNREATKVRYDVTALSFHALAHVFDRYALLPWGASIGDNYGPVVVAKEPRPLAKLAGARVAVPGERTTAALLLRLAAPLSRPVVVPFQAIPAAVAKGEVDAGVVIHEAQLTYRRDGLSKIEDLGEWWHRETGGLPVPLGANCVRRDLPLAVQARASAALRDSIRWALSHRKEAVAHALAFARGVDEATADRFIGMYVDDVSLARDARRRAAVEELWKRGASIGAFAPVAWDVVEEGV